MNLPDYPPLSQMPDAIPISDPDCARKSFDPDAVQEFLVFLAGLTMPQAQPTPEISEMPEAG